MVSGIPLTILTAVGLDSELAGPLEEIVPVDIRIPGCPPSPDAVAAALAELCDQPARR